MNRKSKKTQPQAPNMQSKPISEMGLEFLAEANHLKYNVYLLAQSIIFASVFDKCKSPDEAVALTTQIIRAIDGINNNRG